MICYALQLIHFPIAMLEHGARMDELLVHPECQLSPWSLNAIRAGKDASIDNLLIGGNGFPTPAPQLIESDFEVAWDMGCQQEQRDLRSLTSV